MQFKQLLMALAVVGGSFTANALPTDPTLPDIPQDAADSAQGAIGFTQDVAAPAKQNFVEERGIADIEKRVDCLENGGLLDDVSELEKTLDNLLTLGDKQRCSQKSNLDPSALGHDAAGALGDATKGVSGK